MINITYEDTESAESMAALEISIESGNYADYLCYVGPYSSTNTISLLKITNNQLIISYSASTDIPENIDTSSFVRVNCLGQWQSKAIASFIFSMNWKRIAVSYSDDEMGLDQFRTLTTECDKRNISIDESRLPPIEFEPILINSIERFKCNHIILVIAKPAITKLVVKTATEKGMNTADYVYLFITAAVHSSSEFQEYAGNLTNWVAFVPGYGPLYSSLDKTFISQSRNLHSTHVFDSALVLYYAIRSMLENGMSTKNTTALEWREEILSLPVIEGASGSLDFGPDGNRIIDKVILIINSFDESLSYPQWNQGELLNLKPQSFFSNGYIPNDYHCHFPGDPSNIILITMFTIGGLALLILAIALISYRFYRVKYKKTRSVH
jgi:hypothetical protein